MRSSLLSCFLFCLVGLPLKIDTNVRFLQVLKWPIQSIFQDSDPTAKKGKRLNGGCLWCCAAALVGVHWRAGGVWTAARSQQVRSPVSRHCQACTGCCAPSQSRKHKSRASRAHGLCACPKKAQGRTGRDGETERDRERQRETER